MHGLDFLSGAPKTLIFEKGSNKTNFGGVLTIIYLIIVLIIIITYMVDYAVNPKYSVVYTYEHQFKPDKESIDKRYNNKDLNPKMSFNLKMGQGINAEHFVLAYSNPTTNETYYPKFGETITENLYDLVLLVFYRCNTTKNNSEGVCELNDDEIKKNYDMNLYELTFNYSGSKIDHQNSDSPLKEEYIQTDFTLSINDKISVFVLRWKTIKYTEERGIAGLFDDWFGITNEYYGGLFMDPLVYNIENPESFKERETDGLKIIGMIAVNQEEPNNYMDLYSRTKKGVFDPISSICSLALTVFNAFTFVYCGYYSDNFDNYKIVEKVLSKNKKRPIKMKDVSDNIEISDDSDKKDALLNSNSDNNEENKIENDKEKDQNSNNDINEKEEERILPRLHFYDFLFNNFYSKKYCPSMKHDLLVTCNEIVSRYNSVDYILYNQIKLENLLKDYKWNNPKLNDVQNNELMKDLNLLIG